MVNKCFKAIQVYNQDHEIFSQVAEEKGVKICMLFHKFVKKNFPKRYEVK